MSDQSDQNDNGQPEQTQRPRSPSQSASGTEGQQRGQQGRPQRTFYSADIGERFLQQMRESVTQYEQQIERLTRLLERTMSPLEPRRDVQSPTSIYGSPEHQAHEPQGTGEEPETGEVPDPIPARTAQPRQATRTLSDPLRTFRGTPERHVPRPPLPRSPTRQSEGTAVPALSVAEGTGRLPGTRLPHFCGRDNENVLSWLQKIDMALTAARVPESGKLANVVPLIRGDADSWLYWFLTKCPHAGPQPTYDEFKLAIIRKYESSDVRNEHLRARIQSVQLGPSGLSNIPDFITRFRSVELQIHDMAFKDRFHYFTRPLPNDLSLYLKDQRFGDMETGYEASRQWTAY